jgi:hypothetical protein
MNLFTFSYTEPGTATRHRQVQHKDIEEAKRDMHHWVTVYCATNTCWAFEHRETP